MKPNVQKSSKCYCMKLLTQPTVKVIPIFPGQLLPWQHLFLGGGRFGFFWSFFFSQKSSALTVTIRVAGGSPEVLRDLDHGRNRCCSLQYPAVCPLMLGGLTELRAHLLETASSACITSRQSFLSYVTDVQSNQRVRSERGTKTVREFKLHISCCLLLLAQL